MPCSSSRRDDGEIRQVCIEEREIDDAPAKEGHAQEWVRTDGEKPQAGDRYRTQRGAQEGREGTPQVLRRPKRRSQEAMSAPRSRRLLRPRAHPDTWHTRLRPRVHT